MKPLKKPDIAEMVAKDLGMDTRPVLKMVNCYWGELVQAVRDMRYINIKIHEIGELRMAKSKSRKYKERLENKIQKHGSEITYVDSLKRKLDMLTRAAAMMDEEYEKRAVVRSKRKQYDEAKKNLGKQVAHPGGNMEQSDDPNILEEKKDSKGEKGDL